MQFTAIQTCTKNTSSRTSKQHSFMCFSKTEHVSVSWSSQPVLGLYNCTKAQMEFREYIKSLESFTLKVLLISAFSKKFISQNQTLGILYSWRQTCRSQRLILVFFHTCRVRNKLVKNWSSNALISLLPKYALLLSWWYSHWSRAGTRMTPWDHLPAVLALEPASEVTGGDKWCGKHQNSWKPYP